MMTLNQIKQAVEQGHTVHWKTNAYKLWKDSRGNWWVNSVTGFVTPLKGHKTEDFYLAQGKAEATGTSSRPTD
jgi:hypothetical protein